MTHATSSLTKVVPRDAIVINTQMTYFDEGVFGRLYIERDLYNHFGSDGKRARVRKPCSSEGASNGEMMVDCLIEVSNALLDIYFVIYTS